MTAVNVLKQVVALKPGDTLSAKLLQQLDPSQDKPATAAAEPPPRPTRLRPQARRSPAPGTPSPPPTPRSP